MNKPPNTRNKVHNSKHTKLYFYSPRDIENSIDLIIGEPLTNAIQVFFSLIFVRNVTLSLAPNRLSTNVHFWLH